jgi:hypothetical protein
MDPLSYQLPVKFLGCTTANLHTDVDAKQFTRLKLDNMNVPKDLGEINRNTTTTTSLP